jgi:hypothetical protein
VSRAEQLWSSLSRHATTIAVFSGTSGFVCSLFLLWAATTGRLDHIVTPGTPSEPENSRVDASTSPLARHVLAAGTAGSPDTLIPTPPQSGGPYIPQALNGAISWDAAPSTSISRLLPLEAGVTQFYWALDNDGGVPPYQPNTGATGGDGSTYAMANIAAPCGTDKTGLFFGALRCLNNTSGVGSGLWTADVASGAGGITTKATMSAWVWPISFSSNGQYVSWAYRPSTWTTPYVTMSISQTSTNACWTCSVAVAGVLVQAPDQTCISQWPGQQYLSQWQLLTCVWNSPDLSIYYNGEFIYSAVADSGTPPLDYGTGGPIMLMTSIATSGAGSNGFVDDVRIESEPRDQTYNRKMFQVGMFGSQN